MLTIIPAPKLDPGIESFLVNWTAAKNTKYWSQGTQGCWCDGPLSGLEANGVDIPPALEADFAERQRRDYIDRGILDPAVLTPEYEQTYGYQDVFNLWDPLHFDITLLGELAERGKEWAAHYMSRVLFSYFKSADAPWLRNGGAGSDTEKPKPWLYGDKGRHRNLGRCIQGPLKASRVYKAKGDVGAYAYCLQLVGEHIERAIAHYPLRDEPQGDGLLVPHCRTFMTGTLLSALKRVSYQGGALGERALDAFKLYAQVVRAARRGHGSYVYDVAWDDEAKVFYEHPKEIPRVGIYTVNCWLVDAIGVIDPTWRDEFDEEAQLTHYAEKRPIDAIAFFGTLNP